MRLGKKGVSFLMIPLLTSMLSPGAGVYAAEGQATPAPAIQQSSFHDLPGHWAEKAIQKWLDKGLTNGYEDGSFTPDGVINRAEFTALANRLFGLKAADKEGVFKDVGAEDWFAADVVAAQQHGYITGYPDGTFRPSDPVSREDAALILTRVFALSTEGAKALSLAQFNDANAIQEYARAAVNAMVGAGYMEGYENNRIQPGRALTRAEALAMMDRMAGQLFNEAGAVSGGTIAGNAVVSKSGVVLKDTVVEGNLYLTAGIGEGDAELSGVTVKGNTFVSGGGANSIHIKSSKLHHVSIDKKSGNVRVAVEEDTSVNSLSIQSKTKLQVTGQIRELDVSAQADIEVQEKGLVEKLKLDENSKGSTIEAKGKIKEAVLSAERVKLNGTEMEQGSKVSVDAGKVTVSQPPANSGGGTSGGTTGGSSGGTPGGTVGNGGSGQSGLQATASAGTIHGTTKVQATAASGRHLAVKVSHAPISRPSNGSTLSQTDLTITNPYVAGTDISGVDSVNKYVAVYELDADEKVTNFNLVTLTNQQIQSENWTVVWNDEFNGTQIDETKWNFIQGGGGYGNNELQNYTNRPENARIEDGKLVIQARQESYQGNNYTSAKLTTQNKGDWTYGRYEIRAKLPQTQGLWPAIWMMPTDYNLYSGWPACGEIDIMELLGHDPQTVHGTLHYGMPWKHTGTSYQLPNGASFADDFHTFTLDWEPGEMRWYVDGVLYAKQNDWYSKNANEAAEYTYPAPFDRDFFMQLNVAVGGNWPGNPNHTTVFPQSMEVDYVRVYELDGQPYRPAGARPAQNDSAEPDTGMRPPLADGNYMYNGGFEDGLIHWDFMPFRPQTDFGGEGTASVDAGALKVAITTPGGVGHAVQMTQKNLPMEKGSRYTLSFRAWSEGPRTMVTDISGPDHGYARYLSDTTVNLTAAPQTFSYTFKMESDTDANGRLEFNMGGGSSLPVWIDDVRLIKLPVDPNAPKEVLPDMNMLYNGTFDQGADRFAYWNLASANGATRTIGSAIPDRKLKVTVPTDGEIGSTVLSQDKLLIQQGKSYVLTFQANASVNGRTIEAALVNADGTVTHAASAPIALTTASQSYSTVFTMNDSTDSGAKLQLLLGGAAGDIYLDNVKLKSMPSPVELGTAAKIEAENFSDMFGVQSDGQNVGYIDQGDWMQYIVDVKQAGKYKVIFQYASGAGQGGTITLATKPGSIMTGNLPYGKYDTTDVAKVNLAVPTTGDWSAYSSASATIDLPAGVQTFQVEAVGANLNYYLFSSDSQSKGENVVSNSGFDTDLAGWSNYFADNAGSMASNNGELKVDLPTIRSLEYEQQFSQNVTLFQNNTYTVVFDAYASAERPIGLTVGHVNPDYSYIDYINGTKYFLLGTEKKSYSYTFTMNSPSDAAAKIGFNLAMMSMTVDGVSYTSVPGSVYFDNIRVYRNLVQDGQFQNTATAAAPAAFDPSSKWQVWWGDQWSGASTGMATAGSGKLELNLTAGGNASYAPQVFQEGMYFENGKQYQLSFKAKSSVARKMNVNLGKALTADPWFVAYMNTFAANLDTEYQTYTITFTMNQETYNNGKLVFEVGKIDGVFTPSVITISDVTIMKLN